MGPVLSNCRVAGSTLDGTMYVCHRYPSLALSPGQAAPDGSLSVKLVSLLPVLRAAPLGFVTVTAPTCVPLAKAAGAPKSGAVAVATAIAAAPDHSRLSVEFTQF